MKHHQDLRQYGTRLEEKTVNQGVPGLKAFLRAVCLQRRDQLPASERRHRSLLIARWLCSSAWYRQSKDVLTYLSVRSEVDTRPIVEMAWQDGKRVWAPKTNRQEQTMDFIEIRQWTDVIPGSWGIEEPAQTQPSFTAVVPPERTALLLVPAVAFDRRGFRIGYGGGYYDRFLDRASHRFLTIGLAFDMQLLPWVPAEAHDWPVDGVLTERGWKKIPPCSMADRMELSKATARRT